MIYICRRIVAPMAIVYRPVHPHLALHPQPYCFNTDVVHLYPPLTTTHILHNPTRAQPSLHRPYIPTAPKLPTTHHTLDPTPLQHSHTLTISTSPRPTFRVTPPNPILPIPPSLHSRPTLAPPPLHSRYIPTIQSSPLHYTNPLLTHSHMHTHSHNTHPHPHTLPQQFHYLILTRSTDSHYSQSYY